MGAKHYLFAMVGLGLIGAAGCLSPVRQETDALVCKRAGLAVDLAAPSSALPSTESKPPPPPPDGKVTMATRLQMPPNVPGSEALQIEIPKGGLMKLPPAEQDKILAKYFPPQLSMGPEPSPEPGPDGRPLTLADLQRLARENSPLLRQAAGAIAAAEGAAWEAGMYPNPTVGMMSNAISFTAGSTNAFTYSQTIKTGGKLKLAQAMAAKDLMTAQLAYRRAETDLMASVRTSYYAVLVADASIRANRALADLTDEVYKVMLVQLKGGEVAPYEPLQVGVFATQARMALISSRNQYLLSWKQLASALGLPAMRATEVAGSIDQNLPRFDYEKCLAHILAKHTDALTAQNGIDKMRYNLRLNEVTPIPDFTVGGSILYDASPPGPPRWVPFFTGSIALPLWDRNQGGIKQAQGQLVQAIEEPHRVRAALTASVSDAYRRLEENRVLLDLYRKQVLNQQAQAFRAVVLRHYGSGPQEVGGPGAGGPPAYNDLIAAEQNVVTLIGTYLATLGAYWQAVSDIASLLQVDDAYEMADHVENCPMPNLAELLKLPCCHPCSSMPNLALKGISSLEAPPGRKTAPELSEKAGSDAKPPAAPTGNLMPPSPAPNSPKMAPNAGPGTPPAAFPGRAVPALGTPIGALLRETRASPAPEGPGFLPASSPVR